MFNNWPDQIKKKYTHKLLVLQFSQAGKCLERSRES